MAVHPEALAVAINIMPAYPDIAGSARKIKRAAIVIRAILNHHANLRADDHWTSDGPWRTSDVSGAPAGEERNSEQKSK
jgi:hypothetical protein